jgi:putative SOS response-associated peptidase YedK
MCGCYELKAKARELNRHFPLLHLAQSDMPRGIEMHPTDPVLIITASSTGYLGHMARWGLVGSFLDQPPRHPMINLHSENLANTPFYSKILKRNRCLIPATAFYESQSVANGKQKIRISHATGETLMFAGVFDHHPLAGTTCAMLTTAADATISLIHDRMPLILNRDECSFWLEEYGEFPECDFATMLQARSPQGLKLELIAEEAPSPQLSLAFA